MYIHVFAIFWLYLCDILGGGGVGTAYVHSHALTGTPKCWGCSRCVRLPGLQRAPHPGYSPPKRTIARAI